MERALFAVSIALSSILESEATFIATEVFGASSVGSVHGSATGGGAPGPVNTS